MQGGISDLNANSVFASALFCTSGSKRLANSCMQFAFKARVQEKLKLCIVLKVAKGS